MAMLNTSYLPVGLVKGLNEVLKALDRKQALICVLASDCEDMKYKKFVTVSRRPPHLPHSSDTPIVCRPWPSPLASL